MTARPTRCKTPPRKTKAGAHMKFPFSTKIQEQGEIDEQMHIACANAE